MMMGAAYIGEVRAFAFPFVPSGWLECDGSLLPIMEYQPLFALLGTTYGGNGETDFGLPKIPPLASSPPQPGLTWRISFAGLEPPRS
jgi:microcystin-dependent protein